MSVTPTLRTARLLLDRVRVDDAPAVAGYCADPVLQGYVPVPVPYTLADAESYVTDYADQAEAAESHTLWAIRRTDDADAADATSDADAADTPAGGLLLGVIELRHSAAREGSIGFWLGSPHRGAGIMLEAVGAVVDHAFATLDQQRISWEAVVGNVGSAKTARAAGFRFEGTSRRRLDLRGTLLDEWTASLLPEDDRTRPGDWPL
jgi:RimJ/RimL family protein N-acetyltransferase